MYNMGKNVCCITIRYKHTNNIIKRIKVKQGPSKTRSYAIKNSWLSGTFFCSLWFVWLSSFDYRAAVLFSCIVSFSIAYQLHVCSSDGCQWWTVATPHRSDVLYYPWWSVDAVPSCGGVETSRGQEFWQGQSVGLLSPCCPTTTP